MLWLAAESNILGLNCMQLQFFFNTKGVGVHYNNNNQAISPKQVGVGSWRSLHEEK
jgi:hypothetical protein